MNIRFNESNPIPPGSRLRLARSDDSTPDWEADVGRFFSVGYYNSTDGLNVVWLVNDEGEYEQTTDQESINVHFDLLSIADNKDFFGLCAEPGSFPS